MSDNNGSGIESMSEAPAAPRWLVSIAVMITTVMVILDMTIVNVTLPHMMGALGATANQITWVLTSYIVASAITIPLTGFLSGRFGRRQVMLVSVAGFVAASALCGQAHSLLEMILFRIAQGVFGAPLIPLSQSVMVDIFPKHERGKAMALWGVGLMLAPVLGPTLGGYITQHLSWRWVFYINVPVGLLNLVLISRLVAPTTRRKIPMDWIGATVMALGVGSLQLVLDRGNQEGWFGSGLIILLTAISAIGLILFVYHGLRIQTPIVNLRLFHDRNLTAASIMIVVFGLGMFGTIAMQPLLLERLLGYPAETTGLVMAPRAVGSAVSMLIVSRLITRFDPRWLVSIGLVFSAAGTYLMTWYNLYISPGWVIWPGVIQGIGMGMIFVPLSTIAYETLPKSAVDEASGLFNLIRTLGSSIGISIASTVLTRSEQSSWNYLSGHINVFNPALHNWLNSRGLELGDPTTPLLLGQMLLRQSSMVAFVDVFWVISISFLILAPLLFIMRKPAPHDIPKTSPPD